MIRRGYYYRATEPNKSNPFRTRHLVKFQSSVCGSIAVVGKSSHTRQNVEPVGPWAVSN